MTTPAAKHSHPYMTRSKSKVAYTTSEYDRKTPVKQVKDPYISYADGIKLYMNRGISDDSYISAEYEDEIYMSQTSNEEPVAKKQKKTTKKETIKEQIKKIDDDSMALDDYIII